MSRLLTGNGDLNLLFSINLAISLAVKVPCSAGLRIKMFHNHGPWGSLSVKKYFNIADIRFWASTAHR